jgi:hypothetical protein
VLYRPALAAALMFVVVRAAIAHFGTGAGIGKAAGCLPLYIGVGATSYLAALYLLWRFAGRPVGAEMSALGYLEARVWRRICAWCALRRSAGCR